MAQPSNERTLISAIIPPEVVHINSTFSITFEDDRLMVEFAGLTSSIVYDYFLRTMGKQNIMDDVLQLLPIPESIPVGLLSRTLRLNCVSKYYASLWEEIYNPLFSSDGWAKPDNRLKKWDDVNSKWNRNTALRTPFERRQALVEIDVLSAMTLDLSISELLTIYRVQFPVFQKNERRLRFDQRGMEVPMKTIGGELGVDENHPRFGEMVPPFTSVDREEDYRVAWAFFEKKLKEEKK